ncbi:tyrosine-type recombinase/integrase [Caldithrix abyssi]|nr:tyrosine-type recombinase/integrase [Caldithrix abyssi]
MEVREIEKKDIHHRERDFKNALKSLEKDQAIITHNKELILRFIRDCRLGKTLRNRQRKVIGVARCLKYIQILRRISFWFDKPFDKVTQEDMEKIIENLENNIYKCDLKWRKDKIIKTRNLSHATKVIYKITIRKFYKWLLGNSKHYPELVEWIETYDKSVEIPALRREEVEKLADASNVRDKSIIMSLFDSGARVEEFLNIRISNLTKEDDTYKVRIVFSKTKPRTIHLPICSKYLDMWLQEYSDKDDHDFLFPITYGALCRMLHRVRKKVLKNKSVTAQVLRHSSATYYSNFLNPFQLCYRYGWTMASKMVNRYLDREGIFEQETPKLIKSNDISALGKQNQSLKEEISMIKESNKELSLELEKFKKEFEQVFEGKNFMKLLFALAENQNKLSKEIEDFSGKKFDIILPNIKQ